LNTNFNNKYFKYRLKYLNLINQTGGELYNIHRTNNVITFSKKDSDKVIILKDVTLSIQNTDTTKQYIITNNKESYTHNILLLKDILDKVHYELLNDKYQIIINMDKVVILTDIHPTDNDINYDHKLVFLNEESAKKQKKF